MSVAIPANSMSRLSKAYPFFTQLPVAAHLRAIFGLSKLNLKRTSENVFRLTSVDEVLDTDGELIFSFAIRSHGTGVTLDIF